MRVKILYVIFLIISCTWTSFADPAQAPEPPDPTEKLCETFAQLEQLNTFEAEAEVAVLAIDVRDLLLQTSPSTKEAQSIIELLSALDGIGHKSKSSVIANLINEINSFLETHVMTNESQLTSLMKDLINELAKEVPRQLEIEEKQRKRLEAEDAWQSEEEIERDVAPKTQVRVNLDGTTTFINGNGRTVTGEEFERVSRAYERLGIMRANGGEEILRGEEPRDRVRNRGRPQWRRGRAR